MAELGSPMRILLFCNRPKETDDASTILEHIDAFKKHSRHEIHLWSSLTGLPDQKILNEFDCLIIHYSISFLTDRYVSRTTLERIRSFSGLKVAFLQDEYRRVDFMCLNLKYAGVHLIYSCAPLEVAQKMYASLRPSIEIRTTLTGYVCERWEKTKIKEFSNREIDVGYRARKCPFFLGKKGYDKYLIGEEFLKNSQGLGLRTDISSKEKDRLYGREWIEFLQNCKATLGTDSGSSIIDFNGETEYRLSLYQALHPFAKFANVPPQYLELDGKLEIQVISPRCFEAAALGTVLILFPGNYSGILRPFDHYLPLKKDFSNLQEVLDILESEGQAKEIIARARKDLIDSGKYSYSTFINGVDDTLEQLAEQKDLVRPRSPSSVVKLIVSDQAVSDASPLASSLRSFFSEIFKRFPDWLRFLAMMTILRKKYFSHLYSQHWHHLKCP